MPHSQFILKGSQIKQLAMFMFVCHLLKYLVEQLDLRPLHTVSSDSFLAKFEAFETTINEFFKPEEALFYQFQVPVYIMELHIEDHRRILDMMNEVDVDSMNQRNKTAVDVYQMFRNELLQHVAWL